MHLFWGLPVSQPDLAPLTHHRPVGWLNGLSFKQAAATLVIALLLGGIAGAWDLATDYRAMRRQITESTTANLAQVRGLAVEAAFLLSADMAGEVVNGLMLDPLVGEVRLSDNFGDVLGQASRPATLSPFPELAERLFGDITIHKLDLQSRQKDSRIDVGHLELRLDAGRMMERYLDRVLASTGAGLVRTVLLCLLVVAVFYLLITKPLLKITSAIARVDPGRPAESLIDLPAGHDDDELGQLVRTMNGLLTQSQRALSARDLAQTELAALACELEARVVQRTAELERRKTELESTNGELQKANRFISDGIRYASRIQTALLPDVSVLDGLVDEITIGWRPFDIVGGDYYWTGRFADKAVIAVMDCTGHGVPGAFMTAVVSSILARILHHHGHDDPAVILALLNFLVKSALRQDRADAPANDGLDAAICVLDRGRRTITFSGANLPLIVSSGGQLKVIRGDRRSLGYRDSPADATFASHPVEFAPGDTFYLYSDGVIDHVGGPNRRLFGRRRLIEVLEANAHLPLEEQKAQLFAALDAWRGDQPCRDDMTFIAFRPVVATP
jgi:serine phosphatase RsbU (regulator of sigma subunit)